MSIDRPTFGDYPISEDAFSRHEFARVVSIVFNKNEHTGIADAGIADAGIADAGIADIGIADTGAASGAGPVNSTLKRALARAREHVLKGWSTGQVIIWSLPAAGLAAYCGGGGGVVF